MPFSNGSVKAAGIAELIRDKTVSDIESATPSSGAIKPISIGSLVKEYPSLRPPVIEGLLRKGEVANLIAKSKVGKSWLAYQIAYSVACGFNLFGFSCHRGRVLLIDNELHRETISHRLKTVGEAQA